MVEFELFRQWMDYGFWYDREKQTQREIRDMFLLAAMGPPGGGRTEISPRFQECILLNATLSAYNYVLFILSYNVRNSKSALLEAFWLTNKHL